MFILCLKLVNQFKNRCKDIKNILYYKIFRQKNLIFQKFVVILQPF